MQNNILSIRCDEITTLKTFFKYVKCQYDKIVIRFSVQDADEKVIRICELAPDKSMLLKININRRYFDEYQCTKNINFSVAVNQLYNAIKKIDNSLIMYISANDENTLNIEDKENNNKKFQLYRLEHDCEFIEISQTPFPTKCTMKMNIFTSLCDSLTDVDFVKISMSAENIKFGKIYDCDNFTPDDWDIITFSTENIVPEISGVYESIHLNGIKCFDSRTCTVDINQKNVVSEISAIYETKNLKGIEYFDMLASTIDIYQKNDFPIAMCVNLDNFGNLYILITPIENQNIQDEEPFENQNIQD